MDKNELAQLQAGINRQIAPIYLKKIALMESTPQGGFAYRWENLNQDFNEATYDLLSARITPGATKGLVAASQPREFTNGYERLMQSIIYELSSADEIEFRSAQNRADGEMRKVIQTYQGSFGPITPKDLKKAHVETKIDFVIEYVLGAKWSGRQEKGKEPLTYLDLQNAKSLTAALPDTPSQGIQVLAAVSDYLNAMAPVLQIIADRQHGNWVLRRLRENTQSPSQKTGGQQLFDPNTGAKRKGLVPGFQVNRSVADLTSELLDTTRVLQVKISLSSPNSAKRAASPVIHLVSRSTPSVSGARRGVEPESSIAPELRTLTKTLGAAETMTFTYRGYSLVPVQPLSWDQATDRGWFYGGVLSQAVANDGEDVTGFRFVGDGRPYKFGPPTHGGNFGMLTHVLICLDPPSVQIPLRHLPPVDHMLSEMETRSSVRTLSAKSAKSAKSYAPEVPSDLVVFDTLRLSPPSETGSYSVRLAPDGEGILFEPVDLAHPHEHETGKRSFSAPSTSPTSRAYIIGGAFWSADPNA